MPHTSVRRSEQRYAYTPKVGVIGTPAACKKVRQIMTRLIDAPTGEGLETAMSMLKHGAFTRRLGERLRDKADLHRALWVLVREFGLDEGSVTEDKAREVMSAKRRDQQSHFVPQVSALSTFRIPLKRLLDERFDAAQSVSTDQVQHIPVSEEVLRLRRAEGFIFYYDFGLSLYDMGVRSVYEFQGSRDLVTRREHPRWRLIHPFLPETENREYVDQVLRAKDEGAEVASLRQVVYLFLLYYRTYGKHGTWLNELGQIRTSDADEEVGKKDGKPRRVCLRPGLRGDEFHLDLYSDASTSNQLRIAVEHPLPC